MNKKKTLEEFILQGNLLHNGKYAYDKINELNGMNTKVCITCPEHGEFWQMPSKHLLGQGCPECAKIKRGKSLSFITEDFIRKSNIIHKGKYLYDKTDLDNRDENGKVVITCPIHGDFKQRPAKHISGQGCPECSGNIGITTECFIRRSTEVHNGKYIYDKSKCNGVHRKTIITCPIHGDFEQEPKEHMAGKGCPECANISRNLKLKLDDEMIKCRINEMFKDRYSISGEFKYVNKLSKIKMFCQKHGEWETTPKAIIGGHGCPKCACTESKPENEIYEYVCNLLGKENVIKRNREILEGKELDIYIPSLSIAIEYNGLRWHSEEFNKDKNYHLNKLKRCNENGIKLIQIFEDEWIENKELILKKIKHILGFDDGEKIYARKCKIKIIDKHTAYDFLNKNHIQGSVGSTVFFGGYYNDLLVGVMAFTNDGNNRWNLTRFATDNDKRCIGLAGKLFKAFLTAYKPEYVKSFADRRWTLSEEKNLYTKLGFVLAEELLPDYRYVNGQKREHKFGYRKNKLHKKYGVPLEMTEYEMTQKLGFYRIWDCGLFRYEWKRKEEDQ